MQNKTKLKTKGRYYIVGTFHLFIQNTHTVTFNDVHHIFSRKTTSEFDQYCFLNQIVLTIKTN